MDRNTISKMSINTITLSFCWLIDYNNNMTVFFLERKPHELTELIMNSTEVLFYVFVVPLFLKPVNAQCLCWLTVLMRVCHTSMKTGDEVLTILAFWVQAGHSHSGVENMAKAGVSKANVPPCRMGSLQVGHKQKQFSVIYWEISRNKAVAKCLFMYKHLTLPNTICKRLNLKDNFVFLFICTESIKISQHWKSVNIHSYSLETL